MIVERDGRELLAGARRLDEGILGEIYTRYSPEVYRYAARLLLDSDLAEDCVAECFSRFLRAIQNGGGPNSHIRAYLYRTAHNWIVDQYRTHSDSQALDGELPAGSESDPSSVMKSRTEREQLRLALLRLPPDQQQVLVLKYLEGFSNEELVEVLDRSVSAIKALQHRALKALRRSMEWGEGGE